MWCCLLNRKGTWIKERRGGRSEPIYHHSQWPIGRFCAFCLCYSRGTHSCWKTQQVSQRTIDYGCHEDVLESWVPWPAGRKKTHLTSGGNWQWSEKEMGLLLHNGIRRNRSGTQIIYLDVSWYSWPIVLWKTLYCYSELWRIWSSSLRSSGVKVWIMSRGKSQRSAEMIAEDVGREFRMETGGGRWGRLVMVLGSITVMRVIVHPLTSSFWVFSQEERPPRKCGREAVWT